MFDIEPKCWIPVPAEGYRWENGRLEENCTPRSGFLIVDVINDNPALFARFAAMDQIDKTHVLEFANRTGAICRTLQDWAYHQDAMQFLVGFWQEHYGTSIWEDAFKWPAALPSDIPDEWGISEHHKFILMNYLAGYLTSAKLTLYGANEVEVVVMDPIDMLKLQFVLTVKNEITLRYCEWCNTPFVILPPSRSTRMFCTRRCAVAASRKKKNDTTEKG